MTKVRLFSHDDNEQTAAFATPWSFLHLLSGVVFYLVTDSLDIIQT